MKAADDPPGGAAATPDRTVVGGLARGSRAEIFDPASLRQLAADRVEGDIPLDPLARAGLEVLTDDLRRASPGLSFLGRKLLQQALIDRLIRRTEMTHGPGNSARTPAPVFIVGPFRTGSTFLHRLMATDPQFRCPTATEVSVPLGMSRADGHWPQDRVTRYLEQVGRLSPRLLQLHPVAADSAEECFALLEPSFLSPSFQFWAPLPGYNRWLAERPQEDWDAAYLIYGRLLSRIGAQAPQAPKRRWVLKSPFHMWGLPAILRGFPEALIVALSRPLEQTAPSTATLLEANRTVFARRGTVVDLGDEARDMMQIATARAEAARQTAPARFLDIAFDDLINTPVDTVQRIHAALGLSFDGADAARVATSAAEIGRTTAKS